MKKRRMDRPFHGHTWPVRRPSGRCLLERSEYRGQKYLCIDCPTLGRVIKPAERKRITEEWSEFLQEPSPVRELALERQVSQEFFEAACAQPELRRLYVKWGPVTDLSPLKDLPKLEGLSLGTTGVEDLSPLAKLPKLSHLRLDNLKRVYDFKDLVACKALEFLHIEGYPQGPQKIKIKDVQFLRGLKNLRALWLGFAIIERFDVESLTGLKQLEYLELPRSGRKDEKRLDELAERLCEALPKLRYGNVVEHARERKSA